MTTMSLSGESSVMRLLKTTMSGVPVLLAAFAVSAPAQVPRAPVASATPASPATASDLDARRAAAARLLAAGRFRERQAVLLKDALRAAEADIADACVDRAATGQDMKTCEAIAARSPAMQARLAASESALLDEVIAASQSIYARRFTVAELDEITRFFRTPVGQRYGAQYPQILGDVQTRKRAIARRYLTAAAATPARTR